MKPTLRGPVLAIALIAAACNGETAPASDGWRSLGKEELRAVSGCAFERREGDRTDFLVVHDSKKPGQPRIGRVSVTAKATKYTQLAWPAGTEWPVDLESIAAVPGTSGRYALLASAGRLFTVDVADSRVSLAGTPIDFPKVAGLDHPNYEGLALQSIGGRTVAVWADRGDAVAPAKLLWGPFDAEKGPSVAGSVEVVVPYPPAEYTRDVSDIALDADGAVWITSAWDDEERTPFDAALYAAGTLTDAASPTGFRLSAPLTPVRKFPTHKVEALAFVPGAKQPSAFGADDESNGGWFLVEEAR